MSASKPKLLILGIRGLPAAHGGFETFAEKLALYLTGRGWEVSVYCQKDVASFERRITYDSWQGIERINVHVTSTGPKATLEFDWLCVRDAAKRDGVCLVLGYNGAIFLPWLRACGRKIITNMDGIEWKRPKWGMAVRAWFWVNEWIAAFASHRLVADHPGIADHLATRRPRAKTTMIPYGADPVPFAPDIAVRAMGLVPDNYLISIARIEPDNSIVTLVKAFSAVRRNAKLVVLGKLEPANAYHDAVRAAASEEVMFPGAIYEAGIVKALRFHARAYLHGHTVGGTNPSLVEALWAGNAVIAHDNIFNRWTAGEAGRFFTSQSECEQLISHALTQTDDIATVRTAALAQASRYFDWADVMQAYEWELASLLPENVMAQQPVAARPVEDELAMSAPAKQVAGQRR